MIPLLIAVHILFCIFNYCFISTFRENVNSPLLPFDYVSVAIGPLATAYLTGKLLGFAFAYFFKKIL